MDIALRNLVEACDTNEAGDIVRLAIVEGMNSSSKVNLDFTGITSVTSSFVNSALIALMSNYDVRAIKYRVEVSHANRQIGNMIRDRFRSEEARL
jgi:hypothetical protein